jgi:hypothetical protein
MEQNNNANAFVENLNDENVHYLVEKLENLDVNNIDVDTVNDVVLNCKNTSIAILLTALLPFVSHLFKKDQYTFESDLHKFFSLSITDF